MFSTYKPHYKSNLLLAIPVVISQLGHTLVHMADSVIVGHFAGTTSLAAVSLVNSIFTVMMVIGIGISYGLTPLIAQENGKRNYRECGKLLANSLFINTLTGICLFVIIYFGLLLSIDHLKQSAAVVSEAKPYLGVLGVSIIPLMIFMTFKQFAEGLGFTRQAMVISIVGNIINVILGIIFVKGLLGIKPMGVIGVGLSTLIDRCLMAITISFYIVKSPHFKSYLKNFALKRINKVRSFQILKIGGPVAMQYAFEVGAFGVAAIIIGTIGVANQAAHQVAINLAAITYMMASGIAAAATIKTGNSFGRKNFDELRLSANSNYHIVLIFMILTACLFIGLNHLLPLIYTTDKTVIMIASQLLIIAGIFQLFDGAQVVGLGILRGIGDVNVPTIITFIAYWVIGLPLAYIFGIKFSMGANGVWYGLTLGLLVSAALLFLRYLYTVKKLKLSL